MNPINLAIAGVVLIPLIIGVIQAIKRADPNKRVLSYVWFYLALVLGIVGETTAFFIDQGKPKNLGEWAACVVLGLSFGLAAGKAYDKTLG
jgi:hypothetical protein